MNDSPKSSSFPRRFFDAIFQEPLIPFAIVGGLLFAAYGFIKPDEIESMSTMVREQMSTAAELTVPLKVDIKLGENWAEVEEM